MTRGGAWRCTSALRPFHPAAPTRWGGPTGAGKTTVASLLLRLIEPDAGAITVGDLPLAAADPAAWRGQIAWMPQQPDLFHGAVADNIRPTRPSAGLDVVVAAAAVVHADELIRTQPLSQYPAVDCHRIAARRHFCSIFVV